jgi:hypothetical protein
MSALRVAGMQLQQLAKSAVMDHRTWARFHVLVWPFLWLCCSSAPRAESDTFNLTPHHVAVAGVRHRNTAPLFGRLACLAWLPLM